MTIKERIEDIAREVVSARKSGRKSITINKVTFNLRERGYCQRFVRQCYEAALDIEEFTWKYCASNAFNGELSIKRGIKNKDDGIREVTLELAEAGDIIYFNSSGKPPGHTAIYLGNHQIAENTSANNRGNPSEAGTKITSLSEQNLLHRITGIYSMFAKSLNGYEAGSVKIIVNDNVTTIPGWMTGGINSHIIVGLRNICNSLDYDLEYDTKERIANIRSKNAKKNSY